MFSLPNHGSTCYMNSAIQFLYSSPTFVQLTSEYSGDCEFTKLLKDPKTNIKQIIEKFPQFRIGEPHDSQEALLAIIDVLEKSLDKELFYGKTTTKYISKTESTETNGEYGMLMFNPRGDSDLETLFEQSEKMEYITNQDGFVCTKIAHTSFPKILICMFWNRRNIKLPETFQGKTLRSVIVHMGHEMAGHYVAVCKRDDEWYFTNDEQIEKIENMPTNICPYLALYSD